MDKDTKVVTVIVKEVMVLLKMALSPMIPPVNFMKKSGPNYKTKQDVGSWKTPYAPIFLPMISGIPPDQSTQEKNYN